MGSKFEKFSVIVFIFLTVIAGIFVASSWGSSITVYNHEQFEIEDNTVVINGTIEKINKPNDDDFYIVVNGKAYDFGKFFLTVLNDVNIKDANLLYYTIEIGDNITVYESNKIVLNGEIYQNSVFEDFSWFAWLITFIPVVIVVILLLVCIALVGSKKEELELKFLKMREKYEELNIELIKEREKYNRFLVGNSMKLGASIIPAKYCNNCGSEVDLKEFHCKYCGTEVRLK